MKDHIKAIITEIDNRISDLNQLKDALNRLQSEPRVPSIPVAQPAPEPVNGTPKLPANFEQSFE